MQLLRRIHSNCVQEIFKSFTLLFIVREITRWLRWLIIKRVQADHEKIDLENNEMKLSLFKEARLGPRVPSPT